MMSVDRTYDGFFSSLGFAIVTCTIIVCVGKTLSTYYMFYIVLYSVLIITLVELHSYSKLRKTNKQRSTNQIAALKENNITKTTAEPWDDESLNDPFKVALECLATGPEKATLVRKKGESAAKLHFIRLKERRFQSRESRTYVVESIIRAYSQMQFQSEND